jgi:hypothetical protein
MAVTLRGREVLVPTPTTAWEWKDGQRVDEMVAACLAMHREHTRRGIYGDEATGEAATLAAIEWFSRFWLAGGLWLQQRVLGREAVAVPRQPGRALAREHRVPVVEGGPRRRRGVAAAPLAGAPPPSGRTYTHRWVVNGFWRKQWYPTRGRHEDKWIDSYVKGPEGTPLVTKARVYAVNR